LPFCVGGVAQLTHKNSAIAFQWTCALWLFIFSVGGALLSRRIYQNAWISATVFLSLFFGGFFAALPAQAHGFLIPFRYTPWVLLAFLYFESKPNFKRALGLGTIAGISLGGYQSVYSLFFIGCFVVAYWLNHRSLDYWKARLGGYVFALAIFLLFALPLIITGVELMRLFPVIRGFPDTGYFLGVEKFLVSFLYRGPFFLLRDISDWQVRDYSHGGAYLGTVPMCLIVLGFLNLRVPQKSESRALLVATVILTVVAFGGLQWWTGKNGTFLGLRNWGFTLGLLLMGLAQLIGYGARSLLETLKESKMTLSLVLCFVMSVTASLAVPGLLQLWGWVFCFGFLLVLRFSLSKIAPHYRPVFLGVLVVCLSAPDLLRFARRNSFGLPGSGQQLSKTPKLIQAPHTIKNHRWEPEVDDYFPYAYQLATVHRTRYLNLPELSLPYRGGMLPYTHAFQLANYQTLKQSFTKAGFKNLFRQEPFAFDGHADIKVLSYQPRLLRVSVDVKKDGLFRYFDSHTSHWMATVDNHREAVISEFGIQKAVFLKEGNHVVEFFYQPVEYLWAFWVRLLVTLSCFGFLILKALRTNVLSALLSPRPS